MTEVERERTARYIAAGGGTVVVELPPEVKYSVSDQEFACLCDGEQAKREERWRDICIAILLTALPALLSMLPDLDFAAPVKRRLVVAFVFAVASAVSGILAFAFHKRATSIKSASMYARVKGRIEMFFAHHSSKGDGGTE